MVSLTCKVGLAAWPRGPGPGGRDAPAVPAAARPSEADSTLVCSERRDPASLEEGLGFPES